MAEIIRILADQVVSKNSKGVKFYNADGAIVTEKAKSVRIFETQEALDEDVRNAEDAEAMAAEGNHEQDNGTATQEEVGEAIESESEQADDSTAAPASPKTRGRGKKEQTMAKKSSKKAAKKKVAKTAVAKASSGGPKVRVVAGREHDISNYVRVKNAAGHVSYDNGDNVAEKLRGMELGEVYEFAAKKLGESVQALKKKYSGLNAGMQRMNLGNRLRKVLNASAG